jgi:nitrate reductase gamma subunit
MSCPELVRRFQNFWSDFNAVNRWRFPELPPADLLDSLKLDLSGVDHAEVVRAQWMWTRKPKSLLGDGMAAYLLLVSIGLVLLLVPHAGLMLSPLWCCAMVFAIAKDVVRLTRWRREYESSVGRMTRRCRKTK